MTYDRFETLPVWQTAIALAERIFGMTDRHAAAFRLRGDLRNQLERAVLSISNNIAEGFERGTTQELLTFLYIARGSAGEGRSMLCLMERLPGFSDLKSEISNLKSQAESISRQIRGWADSLQNCDIKGQRHLSDASRSQYEAKENLAQQRARAESFWKEIDQLADRSRQRAV